MKIGIVGLPNVGKSTLFNALLGRRIAKTAAYPFTTVEPHEAVVAVPDERLEKLAELIARSTSEESPSTTLGTRKPTSEVSKKPQIVPATVTFIDIAGLVKGANEGAGLGNQFLGKIREVDAIVHVVRVFNPSASSGQGIPHVMGDINPARDIEVVNLELELGGITGKPVIYVVNVDETSIKYQISSIKDIVGDVPVIAICAKLEEELSDLSPDERKTYLKELGIEETGLEKLIKEAYKILGLISFYTIKGGKEIHAWSLRQGASALEAAGMVHSDFAKNFIKAEVMGVDDLLTIGGWKRAKEQGLIRLEGKDYIVQSGDVIEFLISL